MAEASGVRCLAIKGPVLEAHDLRLEHTSIDVDVLVEPARMDDLVGHLGELGWTQRIKSTTATIGTFHSRPLAHADWPCEIDVHDRFPGFLSAPEDVFDLLWSRRTLVPLAGRSVPATDLVGSVLVAGLHYLRTPESRRLEMDALVVRARARLHRQDLENLSALSAACGASGTVMPLLVELVELVELGTPAPPEGADQRQQQSWDVLTRGAGAHSVAWVWAFRHTPIREWPRLLGRALLLTEPEIRLLYPRLPSGPLGLWRGRVHRLYVGLRALPRAVRTNFGRKR